MKLMTLRQKQKKNYRSFLQNNYLTSIAKAPGKIILFGEHFVVYENRAILGAIDKYATVTSEKTNTDNILISSSLGQSSIQKDQEVNKVEKKTLQ